jgi:hypothetical protein
LEIKSRVTYGGVDTLIALPPSWLIGGKLVALYSVHGSGTRISQK